MLEIIGLVIACTAIATLARGRGASPVVAVCAAVGGWVMIEIGGSIVLSSGEYRLVLMLAAWGWVGLVAGFVRFVIGASRPKPDSQWSCSNCHYLNNASAVICEACTQPWRSA
jgi:hypothetical protein